MLNLIKSIMARKPSRTKVCNITGITTSTDNFYANQNHVKAVDNFRRTKGIKASELKKMFNQLNTY